MEQIVDTETEVRQQLEIRLREKAIEISNQILEMIENPADTPELLSIVPMAESGGRVGLIYHVGVEHNNYKYAYAMNALNETEAHRCRFSRGGFSLGPEHASYPYFDLLCKFIKYAESGNIENEILEKRRRRIAMLKEKNNEAMIVLGIEPSIDDNNEGWTCKNLPHMAIVQRAQNKISGDNYGIGYITRNFSTVHIHDKQGIARPITDPTEQYYVITTWNELLHEYIGFLEKHNV